MAERLKTVLNHLNADGKVQPVSFILSFFFLAVTPELRKGCQIRRGCIFVHVSVQLVRAVPVY